MDLGIEVEMGYGEGDGEGDRTGDRTRDDTGHETDGEAGADTGDRIGDQTGNEMGGRAGDKTANGGGDWVCDDPGDGGGDGVCDETDDGAGDKTDDGAGEEMEDGARDGTEDGASDGTEDGSRVGTDDGTGEESSDEEVYLVAARVRARAEVADLSLLGVNGVAISREQFRWAVDDFVGYVLAQEHGLTRETQKAYLKQRGSFRRFRTPHLVHEYVKRTVPLGSWPIECCPKGCMAFSLWDDETRVCRHCGAQRYKTDGVPALIISYSPLTPWLRMLLADPLLSVWMAETMALARRRAAIPRGVHNKYQDFYDGDSVRGFCATGVISEDTDIVLSAAIDAAEFWRQTGEKMVPVVFTVLSLPPDVRSKVVCMLPVMITPGPKEPVDMDSFLELAIHELNGLAVGVDGVHIHGREGARKVKAVLLGITTDMPGGDKATHMVGHSGRVGGRLRPLEGVLSPSGTNYYFPPMDPRTGAPLFAVSATPMAVRSSATIQAQADAVEALRSAGRPAAHVARMVRSTGVSGWSALFTPGPEGRATYPNMAYLWALGPTAAAPYDPMHLLLCNVAPQLWRLVNGVLAAEPGVTDDFVVSAKVLSEIGSEYRAAAATVPTRQARALRDISKHYLSFKAVDWLFFLLSGAEVVLYGRVPDTFYNMTMCLCRAVRLLFHPSAVDGKDLEEAESEIVKFLQAFYTDIYRGKLSRVRVCRLIFASLLDLVPCIRQCGPVWTFWQFPLERFIGTLPALTRSRSAPHKALVNAVARRQRAELLAGFAARECQGDWDAALGDEAPGQDGAAAWSVPLPESGGVEATLLRPVLAPCALHGVELDALLKYDAGVAAANGNPTKCFRLRLRGGAVINARDSDNRGAVTRRRTSLVRVLSSDRRRRRDGTVETFERHTFGLVRHFLLCGSPGARIGLAFVQLVCSRADVTGRFGIPDHVRGMDVFSSYGGTLRYIDVRCILESVGCMTRAGRHHVLFTRQLFSSGGLGEEESESD